MGALFTYSLSVGCILIPLYFVVKLGLVGCTFYSFNRKIIMGCYAIALILPLIFGLKLSNPGIEIENAVGIAIVDMPVISEVVVDEPFQSPALLAIVGIYMLGLVFFIVREIVIFARMRRIMASCQELHSDSRWKILLHEKEDVAPFSWADRIVMSKKDYNDGGETIIVHETAHLERRHSIDLMLAEAVAIINWYNPAAWLMRDELATVHEYETDESVLRQGFNVRDYQLLLIKKAVGSRFPSIANSLDHSNLSKRIKMMLQKKTSPHRRWIAAAVIPVAALSAGMLLTPKVASALNEISEVKVTEFVDNNQVLTKPSSDLEVEEALPVSSMALSDEESAHSENSVETRIETENVSSVSEASESKIEKKSDSSSESKVFEMVEKMPQYPGGEVELIKFLRNNLRYPQQAFNDSVQGRVIVEFVVQKDGTIGDIRTLKSSGNTELDAEAQRVVKTIGYMEPGTMKGKPVNVGYKLPIDFRLTSEKRTATESNKDSGDRVYSAVEKMPQYPGGMEALLKDIKKSIKYPDTTEKGRVLVQFVVKKDGSVGAVKILRSMCPELDAEAERIVRPLKFEPGTMNGKPVNVLYTLPIMFSR